MSTMRSVFYTTLAVLLVGGGVLPAQAQEQSKTSPPSDSSVVVQVLNDHEKFSTLVSAVEKAGMTSTLASNEGVTVLAPTNKAFSALNESIESMSKSELQTVLRNHLVSTPLPANKVAKKSSLETVAGNTVPVKSSKNGVTVGGATVMKTNIQASNGIIHAVDEVLVPSEVSTSDGSAR